MTTAADQGVADALESVLSDNTRRVYGAHVVPLYRRRLQVSVAGLADLAFRMRSTS